MKFDPAIIEAIKADHPVHDVASRYVALRRRGARFVGPCPICGGDTHNARFEVIDGSNWVCAVCGDGGDVIRLLERVENISFVEAVNRLKRADPVSDDTARRLRERAEERRFKSEAAAEKHRADERIRALEIWEGGERIEGTDTERYLLHRRLRHWQGARLRHMKAAPYYATGPDGRKRKIYEGPAMLALITARVHGEIHSIGCHTTWLDLSKAKGKAEIIDPASGEILPAKKVRGSKRGGFIFLGRTGKENRVVIGEGIETVLAARTGAPDGFEAMWLSSIDLGNLGGPAKGTIARNDGSRNRVPSAEPDDSGPSIEMPPNVSEIVILGDADSDPLLTQNSIHRAARRWQTPERIVRVAWADAGRDFNDMLEGPSRDEV